MHRKSRGRADRLWLAGCGEGCKASEGVLCLRAARFVIRHWQARP